MLGEQSTASATAESVVGSRRSMVERTSDAAESTIAAAYHLDRLEEDGLVTRERDGGSVRVSLRHSTRSALDRGVADD